MRSRWVAIAVGLGLAGTASASCVDYATEPKRLVDLEPQATMGALPAEALACLESSYAAAKEQTTKGKISRVLLVNAYATDTRDWARLVDRHLQEVDQSDPDIAYLYAFYLYNHEPVKNAEAVIHWADIGLERRAAWTGKVFVDRVNGLMRLRTLATVQLWKDAQTAALTDASKTTAADEARARAKTSSREWLDFARSAGRDTTQAWEVCVSAASAAVCGEGG